MAKKIVKIWYDQEGDYLEVLFEREEGYFKETENDQGDGKSRLQGKYPRLFCPQSEPAPSKASRRCPLLTSPVKKGFAFCFI